MRPKSAVNRRKLTNEKKSESKTKKKQPYNTSYSSVSRVQSRYTSMTHKWQIKTQKLKVCKDAKSIALIHAYQPKRLKQCIVSDPISYQRFYNNFGQCELTNMYTKSFLKHFREWRRNLRQRITNVVSMLSETKEQIKPEQVQMVLRQIEGITEQLKSATSAVLNAKDAQNSKGARELFENFEHMEDYIKKLAEIVRHLCQYIKYINKLLQEGADNSQQQSLREIQKKVKKLHKEYERKLVQPLQFCTSHPESTFMNRTEYKMKLKFDHIAKQAIKILEQIFKLTIILQNFQGKFQAYTDKKMRPQQYTADILQEIATLISTYEQYKIKDKGIIPQQQNQITKSNEVILKLKTKINSQIRLFLDTFKEKSQQILQYQLREIKNERVLDSIKNYANRFKVCKKKILTLTKIFNKYDYPQYYEVLTNSIKQSSQNFQNIGELIEQMTKVSNNKKIHNRVKACRVIQSILPFVNKYEQNKSMIVMSISKIIMDETQNQSEKLSQSPNIRLQSEKLIKFLQIMHFSQNSVQQLLSIPHYQVKQPLSKISDEQIEKVVQSNIQQIYRLSHDVFPNAYRNSMQLNTLINDQLINKFVTFSDDIMKESIHSFQIFQQFYEKVYVNEGYQDKKIHKKGIINMLDYFNETMEKFNGYKNSGSGKKFLEWMFENRMAMHVLNSMRKVNKILNDSVNKQYWSLSQRVKKSNVCYRMNSQVKSYVGQKKQLLQEIVRSSSKYVREKSLFDYYFTQSLMKISDFEQNQRIYQRFDNSVDTGEYWPTFNMIYQWDNHQFDYYIDESIPPSAVKEKRKQIYKQLQDCLLKLNKLTQNQEKRAQLGLKFMGECERKIKDIKQIFLPLCLIQPKNEQSSQKVKNYKDVSRSLTSYLIKNNIYHIGLLTQNEELILIINDRKEGSYQKIIEGLQKRLKLDPFALERNELNSRFMPLDVNKIVKQVMQKYGNKKQNSAQFLLSQNATEGKKNANEPNLSDEIQQQNNYDEVFDEQIQEQDSMEDGVDMVQSIIQQTPNLNKDKANKKLSIDNSAGMFILANKSKDKEQANPSFILQEVGNKKQEQFYSIPDGYCKCVYYKIKQLTNLTKVSECLKAWKKQNEQINKSIKISKLVLGFEKQQPNKQLVDHLNEVISQTSKNNLMSVLNSKNKLTKNQQILQSLKQALLSYSVQISSPQVLNELNAKKQKALTAVCHLINCKYSYLYDEGDEGNRIVLCQFANNQNYMHAVLNNQNPFTKQGSLISDRNCVAIEKLYLSSLLKLPHEKNGNMQQIIGEVKKCNEQIAKKYKKLKDTLQVYKKQGYIIENQKQVDKKIGCYYEQKSKKERQFSVPGLIDYDSYKIFLSDYEDIFNIQKGSKSPKICKILMNNSKSLPLFMSSNPQQVKNVLSSIIPSGYNGSPFVERISLEMINIKYGDILKHIFENELKDYKNLPPSQIFQMLYGSGYGSSNNISPYNKQAQDKICRLLQKLDNLFQTNSDRNIAKDITNVANLGKIVGLMDYLPILNKLGQIQRQKQLLEKIATIQKSSATFLLKNNGEIQKQSEYLQNLDDCVSFILEREAQKVEIPSYILQEVNEILNKMMISHWVMRHKNSIVGLGDGDVNVEMAMKKCLNIKDIKNIKWKQKRYAKGECQKFEKQIEIEQLAIYLSISNKINESIIKGKEGVAHQAIDNHFIEINNENNIQTVVSISKMSEKAVIVQCKYPRRSIQIKLKKKVNPNDNKSKSKNIQIDAFITKCYNYGSKYNLIAFQTQIIKDILTEYDKLKIQEQRIREQELKRKLQQQQLKIKEEEERLKKLQLELRKKQEDEIRRKILENQIRNQIQQQQKQKQLKQEKERQKQREEERQKQRIKEKEKEKENKKEEQKKKKEKRVGRKEKGKIIIIKNRGQKDDIELFYNYSEDDRRQVAFEKIQKRSALEGNKQKKIEKESTNSQQSQMSEMSIILSENNEIQRQQLKKKNRIYRFTNVNELIKANKAMFILDE